VSQRQQLNSQNMSCLLVRSTRPVNNERRFAIGPSTHEVFFPIVSLKFHKGLRSEFMVQYNRREQFSNHGPCERVSKIIMIGANLGWKTVLQTGQLNGWKIRSGKQQNAMTHVEFAGDVSNIAQMGKDRKFGYSRMHSSRVALFRHCLRTSSSSILFKPRTISWRRARRIVSA